jgi:hypothetical protein
LCLCKHPKFSLLLHGRDIFSYHQMATNTSVLTCCASSFCLVRLRHHHPLISLLTSAGYPNNCKAKIYDLLILLFRNWNQFWEFANTECLSGRHQRLLNRKCNFLSVIDDIHIFSVLTCIHFVLVASSPFFDGRVQVHKCNTKSFSVYGYWLLTLK